MIGDNDKVYQGVIVLEALGQPKSAAEGGVEKSDEFTVVVNVPNFPPDDQNVGTPPA